jgi:hypothetical protein
MDGKQYYTYRKGNAQFYALDSNYIDPKQLSWLKDELQSSNADGRSATSIILCIRMRNSWLVTELRTC